MAQGQIVGIAAMIGLAVVLIAFVFLQTHPSVPGGNLSYAQIPSRAGYDQVFKYCTQIVTPDNTKLAELRSDPLYGELARLKPGTYETSGDGTLYLMDGSMFELALPPQLQVVRNMGSDVKSWSASDQPRSVIGCTTTQLVRALETYNLKPAPPQAPPPAPGKAQ